MTTEKLMDQVDQIKKKAAARKKAIQKADAEISPPPAKKAAMIPVQLPIWEEPVRAIPNSISRSSLFRVGSKKIKRKYFNREQMASLAGYKIEMTGQELRIDDEDVWLSLLHISRRSELGECVEFTGYEILKQLSWGYSKNCYERLRSSIERLSANNITIASKDEAIGFSGSLIRKFAWKEDGAAMKRWKVWMEPELIQLFGQYNYTLLDWQMRMSLSKPMSKKLFTFYYSHAEPYGIYLDTLKELVSSDAGRMSTFRAQIREGLKELTEIGMLSSWKIDSNDKIFVERNPVRRGIVQ